MLTVNIHDAKTQLSKLVELAAQGEAFQLLTQLRQAGIAAAMDFAGRSLKGQMRSANRWGARVAALLGAQERAQGTVTLKLMSDGTQAAMPRPNVIRALKQRLA